MVVPRANIPLTARPLPRPDADQHMLAGAKVALTGRRRVKVDSTQVGTDSIGCSQVRFPVVNGEVLQTDSVGAARARQLAPRDRSVPKPVHIEPHKPVELPDVAVYNLKRGSAIAQINGYLSSSRLGAGSPLPLTPLPPATHELSPKSGTAARHNMISSTATTPSPGQQSTVESTERRSKLQQLSDNRHISSSATDNEQPQQTTTAEIDQDQGEGGVVQRIATGGEQNNADGVDVGDAQSMARRKHGPRVVAPVEPHWVIDGYVKRHKPVPVRRAIQPPSLTPYSEAYRVRGGSRGGVSSVLGDSATNTLTKVSTKVLWEKEALDAEEEADGGNQVDEAGVAVAVENHMARNGTPLKGSQANPQQQGGAEPREVGQLDDQQKQMVAALLPPQLTATSQLENDFIKTHREAESLLIDLLVMQEKEDKRLQESVNEMKRKRMSTFAQSMKEREETLRDSSISPNPTGAATATGHGVSSQALMTDVDELQRVLRQLCQIVQQLVLRNPLKTYSDAYVQKLWSLIYKALHLFHVITKPLHDGSGGERKKGSSEPTNRQLAIPAKTITLFISTFISSFEALVESAAKAYNRSRRGEHSHMLVPAARYTQYLVAVHQGDLLRYERLHSHAVVTSATDTTTQGRWSKALSISSSRSQRSSYDQPSSPRQRQEAAARKAITERYIEAVTFLPAFGFAHNQLGAFEMSVEAVDAEAMAKHQQEAGTSGGPSLQATQLSALTDLRDIEILYRFVRAATASDKPFSAAEGNLTSFLRRVYRVRDPVKLAAGSPVPEAPAAMVRRASFQRRDSMRIRKKADMSVGYFFAALRNSTLDILDIQKFVAKHFQSSGSFSNSERMMKLTVIMAFFARNDEVGALAFSGWIERLFSDIVGAKDDTWLQGCVYYVLILALQLATFVQPATRDDNYYLKLRTMAREVRPLLIAVLSASSYAPHHVNVEGILEEDIARCTNMVSSAAPSVDDKTGQGNADRPVSKDSGETSTTEAAAAVRSGSKGGEQGRQQSGAHGSSRAGTRSSRDSRSSAAASDKGKKKTDDTADEDANLPTSKAVTSSSAHRPAIGAHVSPLIAYRVRKLLDTVEQLF